MENSIEKIWTKGFLKEEALVAPKINNLYGRKSKLLIEKLKRTYRTDNRSIIPLALLSVIGFTLIDHMILGVYVMTVMICMFILNKKKLASLERIEVNSSSYEYLLEYREMFFQLKRFYTRLLGLGLPFVGSIGYFLFFWKSPVLKDFLQLELIYIIGILLGLAILLSIVGVAAYRLSLKITYGRFIRKLEEMITDMNELRR